MLPRSEDLAAYYYYFLGGVDSEENLWHKSLAWLGSFVSGTVRVVSFASTVRRPDQWPSIADVTELYVVSL